MQAAPLRNIFREKPRIMIVDGSSLVRRVLERQLHVELPDAEVITCTSGTQAMQALEIGAVDFISTALRLPDMDGMELAAHARAQAASAQVPIVVVSGDVRERLLQRELAQHVTDYFDKAHGLSALAVFIRGYICADAPVTGDVLYVEDSRVVAVATQRLLERHGFVVHHVASAEEALGVLYGARNAGFGAGVDVVLSDYLLQSQLTGGDLLEHVRGELGYDARTLPFVILTGDHNTRHQANLIGAGASDLVLKPVEERVLIAKLALHTYLAQEARAQGRNAA